MVVKMGMFWKAYSLDVLLKQLQRTMDINRWGKMEEILNSAC